MFAELQVRIGHWTNNTAATGCTVALFDTPVVASAEVRGGAPATREIALLAPERASNRIDGVVLTGGSAFGLAAADGVMKYLEEHGRGFAMPTGPIPIVPALGLYDLAVGRPDIRPGPDDGYQAASIANHTPDTGRVGAGTGTTISKFGGDMRPGGLCIATASAGAVHATAVIAVNAVGDIDPDGRGADDSITAFQQTPPEYLFGSTTIGLIMTNAKIDKVGCLIVAQGAHDGLARAIVPPHTRADGDAFIATASGAVTANVDLVRLLSLSATERAIRSLG